MTIEDSTAPGPRLGLLPRVLLPRRRADVLSRPRLNDFLLRHLDRRLLLVCAPAGYGKTTLLVDFVHQSGLTACWLTLETADADPRAFLEGLIASVRRRFPAFGTQVERYLHSAGVQDLEVAVRIFVEGLYDLTEDQVLLVLDDVHLVDGEPKIQTLLNLLIAHVPPNFCCILASRTIPRVRLSRFVANREAAGIGVADLRFTFEEIKQLFAHHLQLVVPDRVVENLVEVAEGWIAGIVLTSHVLWQGLVKGLIESERDGPLFDYLAREVFDRLDPEVQTFLVRTSVMSRLSAARCDALLGRTDSAALLDLLDKQNLFLSRLEGEVACYRYHALFGDFLRERLRASGAGEFERLQVRAGELAEAQGDVDEAVSHFLQGGDPERAANLVERVAGETIAAGRVQTLLRWCELLPEELAGARPRLQVQRARAAYEARDLERMRRALDLAEGASRRSGDPRDVAATRIWRSLSFRAGGRFTEAVAECREGLGMAEGLGDADLIALGRKQLGLALADAGAFSEAVTVLDQAQATYAELGDEFNQGIICYQLGYAWKRSGRADRARDSLDRAANHWRRIGNTGMLAMTLVLRGNLSYESGLFDDAAATLAEAQRQAQESGYLRIEGYATQSLGNVTRDRGDLSGARAAYESALAIAERVEEVGLQVEVLDALARAQLYERNLDGALATICRARAIAAGRDSAFERGVCETTYGLILAELGQIADGAEALTAARDWLEASNVVHDLARARLHRAALAARAGPTEADLADARDALTRLAGPLDPLVVAEARYLLPILRAVEGCGPSWVRLVTQRLAREGAARESTRGAPQLRLVTNHRVRSFSLGRGDVEIDGRLLAPSDWVSLRARDLWFYLLAFGPAPKEQIIEALWPEMALENGLNAFHQTLHRLRRSLFPECVARVGQRWRIPESVDSWRDDREFERLAAEDRQDPGRFEEGAPLHRAVELYRGPYLPDLDAEWVVTRRRRLQTTWLRLLRGAIDRARPAGEHERVISYAEQYLEVDPDDEDVHEALMRGHAALGNPRAAIRHFQQYARQLREELDADPPRRLILLVQQLSRCR